MNRNALCACGSGKRFKHCCGKEAAPATVAAPASNVRFEALAAHQAGALGQAESLYRRALEEYPGDIDCLHMLGVVQMERLRYREALDLLWDAAEKNGWARPDIRHNLGLVLGKLLTREANARQADLLAEFVAREDARKLVRADVSPLVTVVIPAYNHARYVAKAIASVAAQTYPHIELIVIDDGSSDGTAAVVTRSIEGLTFPTRFETRANRGAPATLNEGASLARGRYIAFLNSDDWYAPDRIATMVDEIARTHSLWGFSLVSNGDEAAADGAPETVHFDVLQKQRNFLGTHPNSFTLVQYNVAVSSGNLFIEREFFLSLQGFRGYRYNHDWDFCLRASAMAEPVVVHQPLYFYRVHGANTIAESRDAATEDANRVLVDFLASALSSAGTAANALGPSWPANRTLLLKLVFGAGEGALVPVPVLRSLTEEWRAKPAPGPPIKRTTSITDGLRKTAVVVLGMHRSGTSALARVLNLCGAALPAKVKPPKLGVNPKGFWEPEAVLDLNIRMMRQLGGDWSKVDFALPTEGAFVEEFKADACALLESEYGDQETILIKDPRICVLAPLWHAALINAGYRPVYVVPIRNPLEVARSLHARGDMTVSEGLQLWLAYMRRVEEFAGAHLEMMHVRFVDLLDDWRAVVARIADAFEVPFDADAKSAEVDAFLEDSLRRQSAGDEELDAATDEASIGEIRALYRTCLSRCDRDAGLQEPAARLPGRNPAAVREERGHASDTASFVLCIENNSIRDQALLLCESIRRYAGRFRQSRILAFAPRPGLGVDAATRAALEEMKVEYIDEPLNTTCREYAPANRVFAGGYAERNLDTDLVIVMDSDTVWLDEPEFPLDMDAAARPVDSKGSATRGPGDRFEAYWETMARMCGVSLERLPFVRSTIGNEHIRVSYNAGLTVVRRQKGILARCAELFAESVRAGMRPYRGTGMNIFASTGHVGEAGSEYWGSSQTALTLAIWACTDRVLHYPDQYNVPLHLVAAEGDIDPRWLAHPPVHLHYHWMFGRKHHDVAMELLLKLGLSADRMEWLRGRTPFEDRQQKSARGAVATH
jgi:glycosyltransferase involved in cell wall biosynthesis